MVYKHELIELLFKNYQPVFRSSEDMYRNHVYRVFLNCLQMDDGNQNEEKYAIAAFFHDIGIWTNNTIDYLGPSIKQASDYLHFTKKPEWIDVISQMIYWHHKTGACPPEMKSEVEIFRRADWIDVSLGLISYGVDKSEIQKNQSMFPNKGFHWFLVKKITRNFFKHPLHPLPMFKS